MSASQVRDLYYSHRDFDAIAAGLCFASEKSLVASIQKTFLQGISKAWLWFEEFESPSGIADLVGMNISLGTSFSLAQIPSRWAYALAAIAKDKEFSVEEFARMTSVSVSRALTVLRDYERSGYCLRSHDSRMWVKSSEPQPIATKIVAIEAKLRDWKRALAQAARYADFATESWVVIDAFALAAASRNTNEFRARGVGLAGLGVDGHFEVILEPLERQPRSLRSYWQANADASRRAIRCAYRSS